MKENIKKKFHGLKIIKTIAPGGQKEVFVVNYPAYGLCVLKLIHSSNSERVQREIQIVTENHISNVPTIFESGRIESEGDEYLYIFEEFIDGVTLSERIRTSKLSLRESFDLLETLLSIAKQLEIINIVHRDIKPDNILISNQGNYYLIDFGIARALNMPSLTQTHVMAGPHTPGYGAPELFQYKKAEISIKADLFSIGVVVFQAVTGTHPFIDGKETDIQAIWYKTVTVFPLIQEITGDTQRMFMGLLMTLMSKQISRRPPSAEKAYDWLEALKNTLVM